MLAPEELTARRETRILQTDSRGPKPEATAQGCLHFFSRGPVCHASWRNSARFCATQQAARASCGSQQHTAGYGESRHATTDSCALLGPHEKRSSRNLMRASTGSSVFHKARASKLVAIAVFSRQVACNLFPFPPNLEMAMSTSRPPLDGHATCLPWRPRGTARPRRIASRPSLHCPGGEGSAPRDTIVERRPQRGHT